MIINQSINFDVSKLRNANFVLQYSDVSSKMSLSLFLIIRCNKESSLYFKITVEESYLSEILEMFFRSSYSKLRKVFFAFYQNMKKKLCLTKVL